MKVSKSLSENIKTAKSVFPIGKSFDFITRDLTFGSLRGYFIGINGLCRQELLQQLFSDLQNPLFYENMPLCDLQTLIASKIGYSQLSIVTQWNVIVKNVLSGPCVLFLDGFSSALIIDTRSYPTRGISEPNQEKVLRGAKDGFVETLLFNTNLIRRRIRSSKLTFEIFSVGTASKSDIALAYMEGSYDPEFMKKVKEKLSSLSVTALTMGTQSMEELLMPHKWYHPLPSFFRTERPDVACSYLLEGYILLMVDTTPSVLVLPCSIFQFTQSPEDYYKSPIVGNYIRFIRFVCILLSLLLLPSFLLFASNPSLLPPGVSLLPTGEIEPVRIFCYVLFAELLLDLFKYSSSHMPGFSGSLSIVGGLLIGDVAVKLQWASTEVIFYTAATVLASLSLSCLELSDAIRIYRLFLIFLTGILGPWGFLSGLMLILLSILTTPSFGNKSYFWPLFPFNRKALATLLFRYPTFKAQPSHIVKHGDK